MKNPNWKRYTLVGSKNVQIVQVLATDSLDAMDEAKRLLPESEFKKITGVVETCKWFHI